MFEKQNDCHLRILIDPSYILRDFKKRPDSKNFLQKCEEVRSLGGEARLLESSLQLIRLVTNRNRDFNVERGISLLERIEAPYQSFKENDLYCFLFEKVSEIGERVAKEFHVNHSPHFTSLEFCAYALFKNKNKNIIVPTRNGVNIKIISKGYQITNPYFVGKGNPDTEIKFAQNSLELNMLLDQVIRNRTKSNTSDSAAKCL